MKKFSIAIAIALIATLMFATAAFALFFTNGDFESGSWTPGWDGTGQREFLIFDGGYDTTGFPIMSSGGADLSDIVGGPGVTALSLTDSNTGIKYPAVGSYSARINSELSNTAGGHPQNANTLYQTTVVEAADVDAVDGKVHLRMMYAVALMAATHTYDQLPMFFLEVKNETKGTILVHRQAYVDQPGITWLTGSNGYKYIDWTLLDVIAGDGSGANSIVGDTLSVKAVATGCVPGGHAGYIYLDEIGSKHVGVPAVSASGPATIASGATITYTIDYYNGTAGSIDPQIVVKEPAGVTFVSTGLPAACGLASGVVTCNFTGVPATSGGNFQVQGTVTAAGGSTITLGDYSIATLGYPTLGGAPVDTLVSTTPPPDAFTKAAPADLSTNLPIATQLSWNTSTGADSYEYCLETDGNDACDGTWTSVGTATTASPTLLPGASYNWQVRAVNTGGTTGADSGAWWDFTTLAAPGAFGKTTPIDAAIVPVTTSLVWGTSTDAASYEYCLDADTNTTCDSSWVATALVTTASPTLTVGTTYSWQVHAINTSGTTDANTGTWWTFTVQAAPTIVDIFPNAGPVTGGTEVVVTGTNFMALPNTIVTFGGLAATCTVDSATQLTCVTPAHAAGPVDVVVTTLGGPVTFANGFTYYEHWATFYSAGEYDGWVKQKTFGSKLGGLFNNKLNIPVGDDAQNRQIRSILSFNITTKLLPANAKIGAAFVRIKQLNASGIIGTNPFTIFGKLNVDIKKGYFGASKNLASDDYLAVATATRIGTFNQALSGTGWYTMNFSAKGMTAINRSGLTQLRLYFFKPTNKNNKADFFRYYPGDTRVPQASRPQLIIYYTLP